MLAAEVSISARAVASPVGFSQPYAVGALSLARMRAKKTYDS